MSDTLTGTTTEAISDAPDYPMARATGCPFAPPPEVMELAEARRMAQLEQENRRLKQMVAELSLDKEVLKSVIAKNGLRR